jgi:hypothetical protein
MAPHPDEPNPAAYFTSNCSVALRSPNRNAEMSNPSYCGGLKRGQLFKSPTAAV